MPTFLTHFSGRLYSLGSTLLTESVTMSYTVAAAAIPVAAVKDPKANPFYGHVGDLIKTATADAPHRSVVASTVTVPTDEVAKVCRLIRGAGDAHGVTARVRVTDTKGGSVVTFWTVPKITRPRKPKDSDTE